MPKWELPEVDLRAYAAKVRNVFKIVDVEDDKIDYATLASIPTEIDRRRALLEYFIPDVFLPGQYDRRADVIDGCIYYLEYLEGKGNHSIILKSWQKRAGVRPGYNEADLEEDTYGHMFYHPISYVLGAPTGPAIPRIVQHVRTFKGRKRKLDLNDYSLIFFSALQLPQEKITSQMVKVLRNLNHEVQKRPMVDGIKLREYMEKQKSKNVRVLLAKLNKLGLYVFSTFEKSAFGLDSYVFNCPYPHHVRVRFRAGPVAQWFFTSGNQFIQKIWTVIPANEDWKLLYKNFPRSTHVFRAIKLRSSQDFLRHFDSAIQDWVIPWSTIIEDWRRYVKELDKKDKSVQQDYQDLELTEDMLKICYLLEFGNGNYRNSRLHSKTKIPLERIRTIRSELDRGALICRGVLLFFQNITDYFILTLKGDEEWKYRLLLKVGEACPYSTVSLMEDLINSKRYLEGHYLTTPRQGLLFQKAFVKIFHGMFNYTFRKRFYQIRAPGKIPYKDFFDSETQEWKWNPNDYTVTPISFKIR